jgi:hypothetical protein
VAIGQAHGALDTAALIVAKPLWGAGECVKDHRTPTFALDKVQITIGTFNTLFDSFCVYLFNGQLF